MYNHDFVLTTKPEKKYMCREGREEESMNEERKGGVEKGNLIIALDW